MTLRKKEYVARLVDKKIDDYLKVFGAISIEGPKWCGKTWSSLNHANSVVSLDDEEMEKKANLSLEYILNDNKPLLIDEWNIVPKIWDGVRRKCDNTTEKGNYILTCSTKLTDDLQKESIHQTGAGRIGKINMYSMSLFESSESTGKIAIMDMYNGKQFDLKNDINPTIFDLAKYIIRGGWPSNINTDDKMIGIIPKGYIDALLDVDMNDNKKRDKEKMMMLLRSLARNESSIVGIETIVKDIMKHEKNNKLIKSRITINDYLDVLYRLHITDNQNAYSENYRSSKRVGKSQKRHFIDPSLACACLGLTVNKLVDDLNTFGFMFESLVERDLRIYMDYLDGNLFHFRDNVSGLEVDSILEFNDGNYAAVEIKLGFNEINDAKNSLLKFYENVSKKPIFMCVIVGNTDIIVKDRETGIYILPITALRP